MAYETMNNPSAFQRALLAFVLDTRRLSAVMAPRRQGTTTCLTRACAEMAKNRLSVNYVASGRRAADKMHREFQRHEEPNRLLLGDKLRTSVAGATHLNHVGYEGYAVVADALPYKLLARVLWHAPDPLVIALDPTLTPVQVAYGPPVLGNVERVAEFRIVVRNAQLNAAQLPPNFTLVWTYATLLLDSEQVDYFYSFEHRQRFAFGDRAILASPFSALEALVPDASCVLLESKTECHALDTTFLADEHEAMQVLDLLCNADNQH